MIANFGDFLPVWRRFAGKLQLTVVITPMCRGVMDGRFASVAGMRLRQITYKEVNRLARSVT
jgi:hypothetical protein